MFLPSFFFGRSKKTRWPPGIWLAETFLISPLKPLNGIERLLTGRNISMSSSKFLFLEQSEKQDCHPGLWLTETFSTSPLQPILLPVKFRWLLFSGFIGEVENVSANQRPGRSSGCSDRPKNTKMVEDVEFLLPVKFHWILFSSLRGEVENVSANHRPGRSSCFFRSVRKTQTW